MDIFIRQEQDHDWAEIYQLVKEAFAEAEHTDYDEQNLVVRLRKSPFYIPELALVAEINDKIVGYIMFTKLKLGKFKALALAPLAVSPIMQKKGIGKKLVEAGHQIARDLGFEYIILIGHKDYYPRFGYIKASEMGIKLLLDVPDDAFMVYDLQQKNIRVNVLVEYPKEFFEKN